jgi:hypothetical protein
VGFARIFALTALMKAAMVVGLCRCGAGAAGGEEGGVEFLSAAGAAAWSRAPLILDGLSKEAWIIDWK